MRWFRLYWSMVDSVKVGSLDDSSFRTYIELLCLAGQKQDRGLTGVTEQSVSWRLRRNVTESLPKLLQQQLVTVARNNELTIPDWDERQKRSDSSTERVREFRNKNNESKKETLQKRKRNGLEESRGEEITTTPSAFDRFWKAWPANDRKQAKGKCLDLWRKNKLDAVAGEILAHVEVMKNSEGWRNGYVPAPKVYLNDRRWEGAEVRKSVEEAI
jgi:hypothetical protein